MRDVGPASEAEMVLAFLRGEIDSPRYRADYAWHLAELGWSRALVDEGDVSDPDQNARRSTLLDRVRGYPRRSLFTGFPAGASWRRVLLLAEEVPRLYSVKDPGWEALSRGSFRLEDAAANLDDVTEGTGDINARIRSLTDAMANGKRVCEMGELLAVDHAGRVVLFEGHTRAAAYIIRGAFEDVPAIIGMSDDIGAWYFLPP